MIVQEYLELGSKIKSDLLAKSLPPEEFDKQFSLYLAYTYARIPPEYWEFNPSMGRSVSRVVNKFIEEAAVGVGLTLAGSHPFAKTDILYYIARKLTEKGHTCFTLYFDEFLYIVKESKESRVLKLELADRIKSSYFFLLDVPEVVDASPFIQDAIALMLLRKGSRLSTSFSVNTSFSLEDISVSSFLGRLILPFNKVNKFLVID